MRLQVFLSHNGVCSRRDAMEVIQSGRVMVNGKVVCEPATPVEGTELITVDGKRIEDKKFTYVMLHKPVGYTTTKEDPHADKTVMELLPKEYQHLVPVGRLDKDSSGLLLLTNDGDLAFKLTHPSFHEDKTYCMTVSGEMNAQKIAQLMRGVMIEGKKTLPCRIKDVVYNTGHTTMMITIQEGRKRQLRLMAKAVGHHVKALIRVAIGDLQLGALPVGKLRELTRAEIAQLKK